MKRAPLWSLPDHRSEQETQPFSVVTMFPIQFQLIIISLRSCSEAEDWKARGHKATYTGLQGSWGESRAPQQWLCGPGTFFADKLLTSGRANAVRGCLRTPLRVFGWMRGRARWIKVTSWQKESAHSGLTKSKQKSRSLTVNSEELMSSPDAPSTCTQVEKPDSTLSDVTTL